MAVGLVLALIAGSYFTGRSAGTTACTAQWQAREMAITETWRAEVERRQTLADDLQRRLAVTETRSRTIYKEITREIPAATLGRPCLTMLSACSTVFSPPLSRVADCPRPPASLLIPLQSLPAIPRSPSGPPMSSNNTNANEPAAMR